MSRLGTGRLVRTHLTSGLGATATVGAVVLVLAALAVFGPLAVGAMLDDSTRYRVAQASGPVRDLSTSLAATPPAGAGPAPSASLPDEYRDSWGSWDSALRDILTQSPASMRGVFGEADYYTRFGNPAQYASATYLDVDPRYASRIELVEGRLPEATVTPQEWAAAVAERTGDQARPRDDIAPLPATEVVMSAAAAGEVDWRVGETRVMGGEAGWVYPVPLTLVGTFEAKDPADPHWARQIGVLQPSLATDPDGVPYVRTTAIAPPEIHAYFAGLNGGVVTEAWYPLDPDAITADGAPELLADLRGFTSTALMVPGWFGVELPLSFQTGLIPVLESAIAQNAALVSVLSMLVAGPIGVALAVLVLGCRLMHENRRSVLDLLAARGAAPGQLRAVLGLEGLLAGVAPAVVGAVLGAVLATSLLPGTALAADPAIAGLLIAPLVLGLVPAVVGATTATRSRGRERPDAPTRRSRWRPVVEIAVVALAVLSTALLVLRGTDATARIDPLAVAAPLLLALVACVLTLRAYPVALRALLARQRARRGFLGVLGAARALRDPSTGVAPVLALIVGVSFAVASAIVLSMVQTGAVEAARATTGADIQLEASRFAPEQVAAVEEADGVAAVASIELLRSAQLLVDDRLSRVSLYLVDRVQLDEVQEGFPAVVPADVSLGDGSGLPRLLFSQDEAESTDAATQPVHIVKTEAEYAGATSAAVPFTSSASWVLADVAYAEQISDDTPIPVRLLVQVAPGADPATVAAALGETLGDGVRVATFADTLEAVYADPALAGLRGALIAGVFVCAVLSAVAVVVTLVLGARPRRRILALLKTLGAPPRAGRGLVVWELAPAGVAALVVGGLLGALMPVLVASVVDLRPFTRGVDPPAYSADPVVLAITLGGFAAVTVLVTWVALAISRHARVAAVLRTVEET